MWSRPPHPHPHPSEKDSSKSQLIECVTMSKQTRRQMLACLYNQNHDNHRSLHAEPQSRATFVFTDAPLAKLIAAQWCGGDGH